MKKLTDATYWDAIYTGNASIQEVSQRSSGIKAKLKNFTRDYANAYLLREVLLKKFIPMGPAIKTIEVGCAPGGNLLFFKNEFCHEIWGIEYAPNGAEATRRRFSAEGVDPAHVIEADFFDPELQKQHAGQYDFIYSEGLIEHFDDSASVVKAHAAFLKPGGYMYILIPNLAGAVNRRLAAFFDERALKIHNLSIMNQGAFENLFPTTEYDQLFCGYVGMVHLGLFAADSNWKNTLLRVLSYIQRVFNLLLRLLFADKPYELGALSPYLVFIGRKK